MSAIEVVELLCGSAILVAVVGTVVNRLCLKRGFGVRSIQFAAVASIVPGLVLLTIHGTIGGETAAAILGALVGYLFANIAKFDDTD